MKGVNGIKMVRAQRLSHFKTGIFAALNEKKEELAAKGKKLYNLSVGTPDFKAAEHIVKAFAESAANPEDYVYSLRDLPQMLEAVKNYYQRRYGVDIETEQITSVHGTQEGIGHVGLALLDEGDSVLLPDPGYPVFEAGMYLGGAKLHFYPLKEENNFLPDFDRIDKDIANNAKIMVLSYPYNPVCAVADDEVYIKAIEFAKKHGIIIVHDNAYSDIIFDGKKGKSFLEYKGAIDVGIEFLSLSKSFNLTGLRISFAVGRKDIIDSIKLLRTQIDFGMPIPIQKAAIAALNGPLDMVKKQCSEYQKRRDVLCKGLRSIGWNAADSKGTMFAWAKIPEGFKSSEQFCAELMEKSGVICTPGNAFGEHGEGYVRFALVLPPEELEEAVEAIQKSGIIKHNK